MSPRRSVSLWVCAAISAALLATGCGGGGEDSIVVPASVGGTWSITETGTTNDCGDPVDPPYAITVTQNGSSVTVTTPAGTFSGTVSGSSLSWSGSYPDNGGTNTINSLTATIAALGVSLSGSSSWSWTDGVTSCSGTTSFTGTRTTFAEAEPNDSPATAQVVPFPATITGTVIGNTSSGVVGPEDDLDVFRFTLAATGTITITLTGGTTQDMDLVLYDSTGSTVLDFSAGLDSNEVITITLSAGTYNAVVWPFVVTVATGYTLSIQ